MALRNIIQLVETQQGVTTMIKTLPVAIIAIVAAAAKAAGIEIGEEDMQKIFDAGTTFVTVAAPAYIAIRNWISKKNAK